jgi:trans-2,3-dihydro-3-hydroxyanthranilate isomerase
MRALQYHLVDVFTEEAFGGNPLAVFTNGRGIPDAWMQDIAKELNLSETTFVLPPDDPANDYRVRIFTPGAEVPFAGHPTIGTAFVLAREHMLGCAGDDCTIRLEEQVGVIPVHLAFEAGAPGMLTMDQPLPQFGPTHPDRDALAAILGIPPSGIDARYPAQVVSSGLPFLFVPLVDLDTIRVVKPRLDLWDATLEGYAPFVYVFTMQTDTPDAAVHGRMFAPGVGIVEDPATGSANGPLGAYLVRYGLVDGGAQIALLSEQGFEMGRPSLLHITVGQQDGAITSVQVGGRSVYIGAGAIYMA